MSKRTPGGQLSLFDDKPEEQEERVKMYCFMCGVPLYTTTIAASVCAQCVPVYQSIPKLWWSPEQMEELRTKYHDLFRFDWQTGAPYGERCMLHIVAGYGVGGLGRACNGRWFTSCPDGKHEHWYVLNAPLTDEARQWLDGEETIERYDVQSYPAPVKWW